MAAGAGLTPDQLAHETLDSALDLGHLSIGTAVEEHGSLGNGPEGAADVEWYSFTLDQPTLITATLTRQPPGSSFNGVLSLFNNDPNDFGNFLDPYSLGDPYNPDGHRLLAQVDGKSDGGVATLDQLLGQGTYFLAVSGDGNFNFHPLLAGSGIPGSTGGFGLQLSVADAGLPPASGPQVLTSDPAPGASLAAAPLAIRIDMSEQLDPTTLIPGQTVQLIYSPDGNFNQDGVQVSLASLNFSAAVEDSPPPGGPDGSSAILHYQGVNELQLFPASPLARGYYEVLLVGQNAGLGAVVDLNGNDLGANADNPQGQNVAIPFQVDGIDGVVGAATSDDTAATARDLGNLTSSGLVQVAGAIGVDPFYNPANAPDPYNYYPLYNPGNQVDMYRFSVTGPGLYSLTAEVFAGRIGSPLDPGVSLFQIDSTGHLHFLAGNNNTYDTAETTDGLSQPLYTDSALYASLTAGNYCLAVAGGSNTPSPLEGQPPGSPGLFDPNISHSGTNGFSTGPYVLNVLVQPAPPSPHVVATSPSAGTTLTRPPTQLTVQFDEPVNVAELAYQSFQVSSQDTVSSVYILGADGTEYLPRFESYDSATNTAAFLMLNALPSGDYQLHLSGPNGLTDLAGGPLASNNPSGDYVVPFTVDAAPRGTGGNPLKWTDQEPNNDIQHPQNLGVLFPLELAAGVTLTRDFSQDPSQAPQDTADVYEFQILQERPYTFTLTGKNWPRGVHLTLTNPSGQSVAFSSLFGGTVLFAGQLGPGTYLLTVSGWNQEQAPNVAYQVKLTLDSTNDNAPPLLSGPAPAVAIQLASAAAAAPPTVLAPVAPPVTITLPSTGTPPSTGTDPATPITDPAPSQLAIAIPSPSPTGAAVFGVASTDVVALATGSVGGVIGSGGAEAASTQIAQAGTAIGQSAIFAGLLVTGTSYLGSPEDVRAVAQGPEKVEADLAHVEKPRVDAGSTGLQEGMSRLAARAGDWLNRWTMSPLLPAPWENTPEVASTAVAGVAGPELAVSYGESSLRALPGHEELARSDWERAWVLILTFTSLGTEAYAKCRGLGRRDDRREGRSRRTPHGPAPRSLSRPIPRFPLTWLRGMRAKLGHDPRVVIGRGEG